MLQEVALGVRRMFDEHGLSAMPKKDRKSRDPYVCPALAALDLVRSAQHGPWVAVNPKTPASYPRRTQSGQESTKMGLTRAS